MVRKRRDEPHWTRLPFPRSVLQPGEVQEICASPQRELRGPYQLVFWGHQLADILLEEMQVGQDVCGAAWGGSAMPVAALAGRNLFGPCTHVGNQIKLRLRNASVCTQEVQTVLLAEFIPDELRGLGCSYHRHVVRGCDACRERARLRRSHSFSNVQGVAERPDPARIRQTEQRLRGLLDFGPMASIDLGDVENDFFYTGPADDELDLLFGRLPRSPAKRATTRTKTVLDLVQANLKHLVSDQLHGLAASVLKEINLRYDVQGLQRIKFAPDVPPAAPKKIGLVNINPLPPGGIVRHCLNMEVGACGVCSLCIGKATLHVREEPAPAPPPPPPREVPPAKGPEFDSNGFEKQPAHDAPPTQPTLHEPLREVETLEMTSEHPTATPTRAALRKLEEHRYAALVSEFEAWESATDEYP